MPFTISCRFSHFFPIFFNHEQSGGSGAGLAPLVNFYSKLPKGEVTPRVSGIKGRYFSGANASGKPLVALIVGIFVVSYTLDYNSEFGFYFLTQLCI